MLSWAQSAFLASSQLLGGREKRERMGLEILKNFRSVDPTLILLIVPIERLLDRLSIVFTIYYMNTIIERNLLQLRVPLRLLPSAARRASAPFNTASDSPIEVLARVEVASPLDPTVAPLVRGLQAALGYPILTG